MASARKGCKNHIKGERPGPPRRSEGGAGGQRGGGGEKTGRAKPSEDPRSKGTDERPQQGR